MLKMLRIKHFEYLRIKIAICAVFSSKSMVKGKKEQNNNEKIK